MTNKFVIVSLAITEDYSPLIAMIDEIATEKKSSRSAVVRDKLCELFNFTPEGSIMKYDSSVLRGKVV
jgi:hypothetical protein